jgi:mannose-6-phosphate isomerase-like protein (cupin superfamily)
MSEHATLSAIKKSVQSPDETRTFPNGHMDVVHLKDRSVALVTLRPGWKWSNDVRPTAGTDKCQTAHVQYVIRGRLMVEMEDGGRLELAPGDCAAIPPGHDAWVLGDEPFVAVDFGDIADYAKPSEEHIPWLEAEAIIGY